MACEETAGAGRLAESLLDVCWFSKENKVKTTTIENSTVPKAKSSAPEMKTPYEHAQSVT